MNTREYVRPLMRPSWRAWSEIFASARGVDLFAKPRYQSHALHTWNWRETYYTRTNKRRTRAAEMTLSSYVGAHMLRCRPSLDVTLTEQCLDAIKERALCVEWDTINLSMTEWESGETLVTYHHSKIIGGSWIAVIDTATIPSEFRTCKPELELVP